MTSPNPYRPPATDEPAAAASSPAPSWRLRGVVAALVAIYLCETQLVGLFFVAVLGGLVALPLALVRAVRRREPGWVVALKAVLPVVMVLAAIGTNLGNMAIAQSRAERVIDACERFKVARGHYPDRLEELVPGFLPSIPRAKLMLASSGFRYSAHGGEHTLMYTRLPPFGRAIYTLEQRRWSSLD